MNAREIIERTQAFPAELRALPQWVCWDGDKVPRDVNNGKNAKANDPATWAPYDMACRLALTHGWGVGFELGDSGKLLGIDLDHAAVDGEPEPWAADIIGRFIAAGAYVELSPSREGYHIVGKGSFPSDRYKATSYIKNAEGEVDPKPPAAAKKDMRKLEAWDNGRYLTVTGETLSTVRRIVDIQATFDEVLLKYGTPEGAEAEQPPKQEPPRTNLAETLPEGAAAHPRAGDDYNERGDVRALLEKHGWRFGHRSGDEDHWTRPGKSGNATSATWNGKHLYVFTTSSELEGEKSYTKFALYAALEHAGDHKKAAKALAGEGYGAPPRVTRKDDVTPPAHREQKANCQPGGKAPRNPPKKKTKALTPFEPFPYQLLPDPFNAYVSAAANSLQCEPSFIALPLLSAAAAAIGNTRRILMTADWSEPAVIWTAIVGDSGTKKTPALNAGCFPLQNRQNKAFKEHEREQQAFERELQDWERDWGGRRGSRTGGAPPPKPVAPVALRYIVNDITCEALADRLNEQKRGLLCFRDELSGLFGSFDRYSKAKVGGDVAHYLSMYNASSLTVDRKTAARKHIYVRRAAVSLTGGIQPEILKRCFGDQHFENGLAARFLMSYPPKSVKFWKINSVHQGLKNEISQVFERLLDLQFTENFQSGEEPIELPIDMQAEELWKDFYNDWAQQQSGLGGAEAALWSKLEGTVPRLALIFHLVRSATFNPPDVPEIVDRESMERAIGLVRWFGNEARRIYGSMIETDEERDRRELIELIKRRGGGITSRDLGRSSRRFGNSADAAEVALQMLVSRLDGDWEPVTPGKRGGRATRRFVLNPIHLGELPEDLDDDDLDEEPEEDGNHIGGFDESDVNAAFDGAEY